MNEINSNYRSGYVAIIGKPNVGKSTLLNALMEQKLSIVTNKPQTTRQRILGILSREQEQIIFIDTPGLLQPQYLLQKEMVKHAEKALDDADIILVLVEADRADELSEEITQRIIPLCKKKPVILVFTKIDKIQKEEIASLMKIYGQREEYQNLLAISALKKYNLDAVIRTISQYLPLHQPYYPIDIVSNHPERFFVAEFIREQIFNKYREEIPYSTAVEIREFKERKSGKTLINADIIVERDSQKGILIGKRGEALKKIGIDSRAEIEKFLQSEVFLELHVKVRAKWREKETMIKQYGYHSNQ